MSLKSTKGYLASDKESRSHLSKNIIQHSSTFMMFQPVDKKRKEISEEGDQTKLIAEASNSQTSSAITAWSITSKAGVEGEESPRKDIRTQTGEKTHELRSM